MARSPSKHYDATALGSNYAVNEQDFRWVVVHEFERHGWTVEAVYLGNPMRHDEKYLLINQGFAGKQRLMPFFNRQNNDDLILAIQAAGVSRGRNGFRKDKGGEKLAESEEDLLEHRTDGTDAFDTLYIGCEKFPYRDAFSINVSGGFDTSIFWAMRCNDFALANAVLRAVPDGHSRKSFHRRAIVNGATVSAIRLLSLSHGKKIAYLILNNKGVLEFCSPLILSLRRKTANPRNIHYICP